jgi:hypothetical protein
VAISVDFAWAADAEVFVNGSAEAPEEAASAVEVAAAAETPHAARMDSQLEEEAPEEAADAFVPCTVVESLVVPARVCIAVAAFIAGLECSPRAKLRRASVRAFPF